MDKSRKGQMIGMDDPELYPWESREILVSPDLLALEKLWFEDMRRADSSSVGELDFDESLLVIKL